MALFTPFGQDFQWSYSANTGTRPTISTTSGFGISVTPAVAPAISGWVNVASAANVTREVYGILINFNTLFFAATIRNALVDIGVDNLGGTNYITVIPDLIASSSTYYGLGSGGIWYYFPLYIKSGSSVAIRASGSTTGPIWANITLYGEPRRPDAIRAGSYVDSFGAKVLNTTSGTGITMGTTTEGAWQPLGSATTKSYWWWQAGFAQVDTTMTNATIHVDLSAGNATFKKILLENQFWTVTSSEQISNAPLTVNAYNNVASGQNIYGRAQSSAGTDASPNLIAYGLGG